MAARGSGGTGLPLYSIAVSNHEVSQLRGFLNFQKIERSAQLMKRIA